ncbi:MAG: aminotransferase class III-fold pyridoxal phosphate-dependent enzyme [Myxococcales bacterium]|nr:aminotransferase class III-fold pyridoxal phosphate-dependent enzyme [Myxococcales bacterium]
MGDAMEMDKRAIVELAARYVCPGRVNTFKLLGTQPPVMGRREGHYFWDLDGRRLFDVHINGGTFNLGHRNPEVIAALREAVERYDIGNHHFASGPRARLAETLARLSPGDLQYTVFAASGSEANDIAIKTARRATGRRKIVSAVGSYHGHTGLCLAAGDVQNASYFLSDGAPDEFVQVPFNDLAAMEEALAPGDAAAVLLETIPATLGFPMPTPGYLPGVKALCEKYGTLYVADEVQTGLGRTGDFWAVEGYGVEPDVLITGKGLSGGIYPMAAAILSARVGDWLFDNGWGHVSTFGGSEIGCHVAQTVLEIIERPGVLANAREMSDRLGAGLEALRQRHPFLLEVRRNGLVMGLRFDHEMGGAMMTAAGYEVGLWAFFAGFERSVLQFKPGLLIRREECEELLGLVDKAISLCEERREIGAAGR